jgi:hypothetical protein
MPPERNYTTDGLHVPVQPGIFKLIGHETYVCGPRGQPGGRKYGSLEEARAALPRGLSTKAATPGAAPDSSPALEPAPNPKKERRATGQWTVAECALLDASVEVEEHNHPSQCLGKWARIAQSVPGRNAKQCRERWYNHQRPGLDKSRLTDSEVRKLRALIETHGARWTLIAREFPSRSETKIKNALAGPEFRDLKQRTARSAAGVRNSPPEEAEPPDSDDLEEMDLDELCTVEAGLDNRLDALVQVDDFDGFPLLPLEPPTEPPPEPAPEPPPPPKLHLWHPSAPPSEGMRAARQGAGDGERRSDPFFIPAAGFVLTGSLVERAAQLSAVGTRPFAFSFEPPSKARRSRHPSGIAGFMRAKKPRLLETTAPPLEALRCAESLQPPKPPPSATVA